MLAPNIETERLLLRHWKHSDAQDMFEFASQTDVGPSAGWKPHETIEDTRWVIANCLASNEFAWAIVLKESGKVIGSINLRSDHKRSIPKAYILGYSLSHDHWGNGYMPEAGMAIIRYAFVSQGANILATDHYPDNLRSKRVIEKCGFKFEGVLRQAAELYDGHWEDSYCYSMTRAEFIALEQQAK